MSSERRLRPGCEANSCSYRVARVALQLCAGLALCLPALGCLSSLNKHGATLSAATAPVVDGAAIAYHSAQTLHDTRVDYDAVAEFDQAPPVYNPRNVQPLLSNQGIEVRLAVLTAFQTYTQYVVEITSGTGSPALQSAAAAVGSQLASLGNTFAPSIEATLGIAQASGSSTTTTVTTISTGSTSSSTTSTATSAAISPAMRNGISTAVDALAQFLVRKKVKRDLPSAIKEMDQHLQLLAKLLEDDLGTIQDQDERDYNFILNRQTLFLRTASELNPQQRREEIMKLPEIVRQQRATHEQLAGLKAAIVRLALVHHALAADAQGNNPASLKAKLSDLAAAGSKLGQFYSSLPAQ